MMLTNNHQSKLKSPLHRFAVSKERKIVESQLVHAQTD